MNYFIAGSYEPRTGKIGQLWYVVLAPQDVYQSGQSLQVNGKEYILGRRELWSKGEIVSYQLILRSEVLEL